MEIILDDVSIQLDKLNLAVAVETDLKVTEIQNPRIGLIFDNGEDSRRLLIPGPVVRENKDRGEKGTIYANYLYLLESIFYDCNWTSCELSFEIEINGECYRDIPVSFRDNRKSSVLDIEDNGRLTLKTDGVDCQYH